MINLISLYLFYQQQVVAFATVTGTPIGIASLSLEFSLSTGLVKKLLEKTKNKKKKLVMLARSKLNSRESKISEALMNNQISDEDFMTIIN